MSRLAYVTAENFASLYEDDLPSVAAVQSLGHTVTPVLWRTATRAELDGYDAVVVRTPWDWFQHRDEFRAFLDLLGTTRAAVFNPPAVLKAFADKTYLPRLEALGVPVVPTVVLRPDELSRVATTMDERHWATGVLKPAFTAGAFDAVRFSRTDVEQALVTLARLPAHEHWLLQPFLPDITEGEWSFIFFDGTFSHAVKKRPKSGDWRVQELHGGTSFSAQAPPQLIEQANRILSLSAPDTLYARVDGVLVEQKLHLMELEVVEPELFFRFAPEAAALFARGLVRRLKTK